MKILAFALLALAASSSALLAQATITAVGMVVDGDGHPIPDVQVLIDYTGHIPQKYRTKTDKKGRFIHLSVYQGPTKVTFKKEGYGEATVAYEFHDLTSTERPPEFKLSKRAVPPPEAAPGSAGAAAPDADARARGAVADRINAVGVLARAGKIDEAQAGYEALAVEMPTVPLIPYNLAFVYKKKGDAARAEASLRKAIELDPAFADAYNALAITLLEAGHKEEAAAVLEKGVTAADKDARLRYSLGVVYLNAGKVAQAKEALLQAEALDPANAEVHYYLATLALNQNDMPGAVARLEKYIAMAAPDAPNVVGAKSLLGALSAQKK